jgi:hypothetical protein
MDTLKKYKDEFESGRKPKFMCEYTKSHLDDNPIKLKLVKDNWFEAFKRNSITYTFRGSKASLP